MTLFTNFILAVVVFFSIIFTLLGLPGNFLILIAAVIFGWHEDFLHLNYACLLLLAGMWGAGELIEFWAGIMGAKKQQASKWAMLATFIGSLAGAAIGTGILPLIGTLLGMVLGSFFASFAVEYLYTGDKLKAHEVAKGAVKGQLTGVLIKLVLAINMAAVLLYRLWR